MCYLLFGSAGINFIFAASKICSKLPLLWSQTLEYISAQSEEEFAVAYLKTTHSPRSELKRCITFNILNTNRQLFINFVPARTKVFQFNLFSLNRKFLATYAKPFCSNLLVNSHILYERMHSIYRGGTEMVWLINRGWKIHQLLVEKMLTLSMRQSNLTQYFE